MTEADILHFDIPPEATAEPAVPARPTGRRSTSSRRPSGTYSARAAAVRPASHVAEAAVPPSAASAAGASCTGRATTDMACSCASSSKVPPRRISVQSTATARRGIQTAPTSRATSPTPGESTHTVVPVAVPAGIGATNRRTRPLSAGSSRSGWPEMRRTVVPTVWCKSWGERALEEEMKPTPLGPVLAEIATPLEQQLARVLGVEDESHWPRLPMEVGSCDQGGKCCWRWLARAALEQVAGEPMSHLVLSEVVASLRSDMKELAELRKYHSSVTEELAQAAQDRNDLKAARKVMSELQDELSRLKRKESELVSLQAKHAELEESHAKLRMQDENLKRQLSSLKAEQKILTEGDLAAAKHRAEEAERELTKAAASKLDLKVMTEDLERQLARERKEAADQKEANARLQQEIDKLTRKPKKKAKPKRSPRSTSARRPQ